MREFIDLVESAVDGQYMLATYNLDKQTWNVKFFPNRVEAHSAWEQWSAVFTGDAFIGPVEIAKHAKRPGA